MIGSPGGAEDDDEEGEEDMQDLQELQQTAFIPHLPSSEHGGAYLSYGERLQQFIAVHKTRPADIKFWPYGPYWPMGHVGPVISTPRFFRNKCFAFEPLEPSSEGKHFGNIEAQLWRFSGRWSGSKIVFDVLHSPRDQIPMTVGEGICPTLAFESRFESGNLQQVRRVGQFEYDLVLSCDLNTIRHTQWYYFRVQNALPGVTYLMRIVNLSKKDSLYNYGMRPLLYSEADADTKKTGWYRVGHHIRYYKNEDVYYRRLMEKGRTYYMLEWQMEFPNSDDTYYLAHCYPYTFTDLKDDLDLLLRDPQRSQVMRREVLCNTRAGNSCFLVTITDFSSEKKAVRERQGVVVTARVHPGESNSSWVMKGLMDYLTGDTATAQKLRSRFVFKIVPMLNPDGVIVGNYRCGLAGRDLNRNYRQPTKEAFPTVWYTKAMIEDFSRTHRILIYCDLHGHSRKQNVFMYGCGRKELLNPPSSVTGVGNDAAKPQASSPSDAEYFLQDRLFPWLMSQRAQSRFSFDSCQFHIRKCKESTGRVTMFRQLRILNSFTMESTFCGTMLESQPRHFNAHDFEEMGRAFCDVVLQYDELLHSNRQEELDGTMDSLALEALNCMYRRRQRREKKQTAGDEEARGGDADDVPMEFDEETVGGGTNSGETVEERRRRILSSLEQCLRSAGNDDTEKGGSSCSESSSDSDSEPESELKSTSNHLPLPRVRRKKVKSQSQRSHDRSRRTHGRDKGSSRTAGDTNMRRVNSLPEKRFLTHQSEKGDESMLRVPADSLARRLNSLPTLPAIGSEAGRTAVGQSHSSMADYAADSSSRTAEFEHGTLVRKSSHGTTKNQPQFINKYTGRSNGGIPMFAEERIAERAKNVASQAKKTRNDDKDKQLPVEPLSDPFSRAKFASVKMGYQHRRHDNTLPSCQRSLFSPRKFNSDTNESMEPESEECDKGVGVTPAMTSLAARTSPYDGLHKEDAVNSSYFRPTRLLKNEPKLLPLTSLADRKPAALITSLKIEEQRSQITSQPIMSVAASSLSYSHRVIPDS